MSAATGTQETSPATRDLLTSDLIPARMTIVFDAGSAFCRRCADWLVNQEAAVPTTLVPSNDREFKEQYGRLHGYGDELMVIADNGIIWTGPDAFIVAMWCLTRYRTTAMRLTGQVGQAAARQFFHAVSSSRDRLGALLNVPTTCEDCATG